MNTPLQHPLVPDDYLITLRHGARLLRPLLITASTAHEAVWRALQRRPGAVLVSCRVPGEWDDAD